MSRPIPFRNGAGTIACNNGQGAVTYFGQPLGQLRRTNTGRWQDVAFPHSSYADPHDLAESMLARANPIRPGEIITWAAHPEVTGPAQDVQWTRGGYAVLVQHQGRPVAVPLAQVIRAEQVSA